MQINAFRMISALLGLALATPSVAADLKPFKIGISAPVVTIFPVWMGDVGGFYAKEGLKVEVINMEGGTRGLQVLLSGEIQGMHVGLAPAVLANKQGADLRLITSTCNTIPITMFTKAGVTMKDLKGKISASPPSDRRPTSRSASSSSSLPYPRDATCRKSAEARSGSRRWWRDASTSHP